MGVLFLARRYLWAHSIQTTGITLALALTFFLPGATYFLGESMESQVMSRAAKTPVILGPKGDTFDLTLASLYFQGHPGGHLTVGSVRAFEGYGQVVPLNLDHRAGVFPIVGCDMAYLDARGLTLSKGRRPVLLGEVVLGAEVARSRSLEPGDGIVTSAVEPYNLAGAYPYQLPIVGILAETGGPDDHALFVDLKTSWLLDGHYHGHGDDESETVPMLFQTLDEKSRSSFHLHGDQNTLPITAALVFPRDRRAHDQLLGAVLLTDGIEATRPEKVMSKVMTLVFRLREGLLTLLGVVGASTGLLLLLILSISLKLRSGELKLMARMGATRGVIVGTVVMEGLICLALSLFVAGGGLVLALWLFKVMEYA